MLKRILVFTVLASLGVSAAPSPTRRIPAVEKKLGSRYKLPTPIPRSGSVESAKDLADLVRIEQRHFPGAVVTAGFFDWRTTSVYRSHAGLHLGYDIAMPYGCPFAAGWAGTVTAVVPWYGEQHGITVVSPDGTSVTYGHVSPRVQVGQRVLPGDVLGTIALDHVDVKMRDASGNYFDFGGNGRVVPTPDWAGGFSMPEPSREALMAGWLLAQNGWEMAQEELTREKLESARRTLELQALKKKVPALEASQKMMADYVEQGLVSRVTAEENREDLVTAKKQLKELSSKIKNHPQRLKELQRELSQATARRQQAQAEASRRGITWKQVENFVQATIANDKALARNVAAYKKNALSKNAKRVDDLESELAKSNETLKTYEDLYQMGGISRNELEEARQKNAILKAQMKAMKGEAVSGG